MMIDLIDWPCLLCRKKTKVRSDHMIGVSVYCCECARKYLNEEDMMSPYVGIQRKKTK